MNGYQTSEPKRAFVLEYSIFTEKYKEVEKAIHKHFNADHEWVDADLKEMKKVINKLIKKNKFNTL